MSGVCIYPPLIIFFICFFQQAAKTLKTTESLKACHRCGSPAKYDSYLQRATCSREGCGFDFCTKCMCSYHSSSDCMSSKPVKPSSKFELLPGTKKSKHNLQRLWSIHSNTDCQGFGVWGYLQRKPNRKNAFLLFCIFKKS